MPFPPGLQRNRFCCRNRLGDYSRKLRLCFQYEFINKEVNDSKRQQSDNREIELPTCYVSDGPNCLSPVRVLLCLPTPRLKPTVPTEASQAPEDKQFPQPNSPQSELLSMHCFAVL